LSGHFIEIQGHTKQQHTADVYGRSNAIPKALQNDLKRCADDRAKEEVEYVVMKSFQLSNR
jgi:hypothetical protein